MNNKNFEWLDFFDCFNCKKKLELCDPTEATVFCKECRQEFILTESGLPIIIKDIKPIKEEIETRGKDKEYWFNDDQVQKMLEGAWRHVFKQRCEYWKEILSKKLSDESVIMDFGCGDGANFSILKTLPHKKLIGFDYNLLRLEKAKKYEGSAEYLVMGNIFEDLLKEQSFDMIFCNHVVEHIEDDQKILDLFYKYLKPGGELFLGVPNEGSVICTIRDKAIQPGLREKTDHVNFYTAKTISELVQNSKFENIKTKNLGFVFPHTFIDKKLKSFKPTHDLLSMTAEKLFKSQSDSIYLSANKQS
ncbi:MAG: hypothetical protein COA79_17095 [Planctomycetota bacterium]|nr:MAG: hypothetical protein COA79_17095 [Planctomycetota bacterium]